MTGATDHTGPLLNVEQATTLNGQLAHAGVDWVRNARRSLDDVVREISNSPDTRVGVLAGSAVAAHRAVLHAIEEFEAVASALAPYVAVAQDYLPASSTAPIPGALEVGGPTA